MPATTTSASALPRLGKLVQQPVQTRHAHVGHQRHLAVPGLGGDSRLLGHGQVTRARRDDDHPAHLAAGLGRALDPEGSADRIVLALGKHRPEMSRDRRIDPRDQPPLLMLDQVRRIASICCRRLALAEDHFGKPAADPAVEIHLGKSAGIDVGLGPEPKRGVGRG